MLQSMESQRVGHDGVTELNQTELGDIVSPFADVEFSLAGIMPSSLSLSVKHIYFFLYYTSDVMVISKGLLSLWKFLLHDTSVSWVHHSFFLFPVQGDKLHFSSAFHPLFLP